MKIKKHLVITILLCIIFLLCSNKECKASAADDTRNALTQLRNQPGISAEDLRDAESDVMGYYNNIKYKYLDKSGAIIGEEVPADSYVTNQSFLCASHGLYYPSDYKEKKLEAEMAHNKYQPTVAAARTAYETAYNTWLEKKDDPNLPSIAKDGYQKEYENKKKDYIKKFVEYTRLRNYRFMY